MRNPNIEDFWRLETIAITDFLDVTNDSKALEQFNELIFYKVEGNKLHDLENFRILTSLLIWILSLGG